MKGPGARQFARATAHTALAAGIFGFLLIVLAVMGDAWAYLKPESVPGLVFAGAAICVAGLFSAATFLAWRLLDRKVPGTFLALLGLVLCLLGLVTMIPFMPKEAGTPSAQRVVPGP
ncbi:MAG: hypothetical protein HXY22_11565 [Alphaproteobacteria bacterium]|nr:hypothetical protein [Alphaproteobacteria bacterium]